jgi:hypothetical protein
MVREKILVVRGEIWTLFAIFMFIILFHYILIHLRVTDTGLLSEKAIKIFIPFATTYFCEKTFSSVTAIKNKYRCQLEIQTARRVAVTSLEPRIHKLISNEQHLS